jgi:hypothetical protein
VYPASPDRGSGLGGVVTLGNQPLGSATVVTEVPDLKNGATESTERPEKMNLFFEKIVFSDSFVLSVAPCLRSGTSESSD